MRIMTVSTAALVIISPIYQVSRMIVQDYVIDKATSTSRNLFNLVCSCCSLSCCTCRSLSHAHSCVALVSCLHSNVFMTSSLPYHNNMFFVPTVSKKTSAMFAMSHLYVEYL